MYCPNCGKEVPNGAAFCDRCGTALQNSKATRQNVPVYGTAGAAESRKKGMDSRLQFLIAVAIGVICFLIASVVSNQIVAAFGVDAFVGNISAMILPRTFLYVTLVVEAIILLVTLSRGRTTNAALIVGIAVESVLSLLVLAVPAPLLRLFSSNIAAEMYSIRFLRFFGIACLVCTTAFAVIGFTIKKRSIAPDLIMFGIVFSVAFLLLIIEFFMVRSGLGLQIPLHAIVIGMIHAAVILIPCAGRRSNY